MIKLIVADMDGTFLNSRGDFDHQLYKKVSQLMRKKGVIFAICTGKQCERVEELFGEDNLENLWIIGDSATRIKHNGKCIYESLLPKEIGLKIIEKLDNIATDHTIIVCTPKAAIVKSTTSEKNIKIVRGSYKNVEIVDDYKRIADNFVKITVFDEFKRCDTNVLHLDTFKEEAYIVASEPSWIDITNVDVHKGKTIEMLQEMLGITKDETMAFGDGLNDIELLQVAKYSFAMRNGSEKTKKVARFITGSNDENAVLTTIYDILELQN